MKKQTHYILLMAFTALVFLSCKQALKSVDETFNPKDTLPTEHTKATKSSIITKSEERDRMTKIIDSQAQIIIKEVQAQTSKHVDEKAKDKSFLNDITQLQEAETALKQLPQYVDKEIFIYQTAYFYDDGRINIKLQHPTNPKYVDNYEYKDGKWSAPKPEQLSVREKMEDKLISLNKISFTSAARVNKIYNEKAAQIEGAKPNSSVYIYISDGAVRWYPLSISGSRERYSIEFNNDGSLKRFMQN
nr:hypothetical protein [Pedobacter sp. ASV2]